MICKAVIITEREGCSWEGTNYTKPSVGEEWILISLICNHNGKVKDSLRCLEPLFKYLRYSIQGFHFRPDVEGNVRLFDMQSRVVHTQNKTNTV